MHSFVIEHDRCPRCSNLRTARFGVVSYCFNCRTQWNDPTDAAGETDYPFSPEELGRMRVYRAAVRAGFYTDRVVVPPRRRSPQSSTTR
jgi:hypothetical protein